MEMISRVQDIWRSLCNLWQEEGVSNNPLKPSSAETAKMESQFAEILSEMLMFSDDQAEILYSRARIIKLQHGKSMIHRRAAIHVTNVCRANCACCPMRRDNFSKETVRRVTVEEIVRATEMAYLEGYRDMFIQGGEDPQIVPVVAEAVRRILQEHQDVEFTLNLGTLNEDQYKLLFDAGARKYVIKYETATPELHQALRQDSLENRVAGMIVARKVGFKIGSGNIIGIPSQTDADLIKDIIFLGRLGINDMISSTTYIPSEVLPEPYCSQPAGSWEKTKRYIAILRLLFPDAHIHAPSAADSLKLERKASAITGQADLLLCGADEISVEFTPSRVAQYYSLYEPASRRHVVNHGVADIVEKQIK